jgi:hypothetical protein
MERPIPVKYAQEDAPNAQQKMLVLHVLTIIRLIQVNAKDVQKVVRHVWTQYAVSVKLICILIRVSNVLRSVRGMDLLIKTILLRSVIAVQVVVVSVPQRICVRNVKLDGN